MAIFKRNAVEQAEAKLAKLRLQQERLAKQEAQQRGALDAAIAARKRSAREDENFNLAAAEKAQNADIHLNQLTDALDDVAGAIDEAERELATARDQARRKVEVNVREADLAAAEAAMAGFLASAGKVAVAFGRLADVPSEAANVSAYAQRASTELEPAGVSTSNDVRSYIAAVTAGRTPIRGYTPPAPPAPRRAPVAMTAVYALENLKYADRAGEIRTLAKHTSDTLPTALADKCIANGWACAPDSPTARGLRDIHGNGFHTAHADTCRDIESGIAPAKPPGKAIAYRGPHEGRMTFGDASEALPEFILQPRPAITGTISVARNLDVDGDGEQ